MQSPDFVFGLFLVLAIAFAALAGHARQKQIKEQEARKREEAVQPEP